MNNDVVVFRQECNERLASVVHPVVRDRPVAAHQDVHRIVG
ncbi:MAG: hypothetical protein ACRDJM_02200 [Actinomycetota bacterium]